MLFNLMLYAVIHMRGRKVKESLYKQTDHYHSHALLNIYFMRPHPSGPATGQVLHLS